MTDWLVSRLTPVKSREARWAEFARSLEHVWEEFLDPEIDRLERLRSVYTADDSDLLKIIRGMGDYFAFDLPPMKTAPFQFHDAGWNWNTRIWS